MVAVIDTDILSLLMRRDARVVVAAEEYRKAHQHLTFSVITRYEILRGLKVKGASARVEGFRALCDVSEVLPITDSIIDIAADVYSTLHLAGRLLPDADILIAATALSHGYPVVTNNTDHFSRINGLQVLNWTESA